MQREAIPLLLVGEVARTELPRVHTNDDLAGVLETFSKYEVAHLPVCLAQNRFARHRRDQPAGTHEPVSCRFVAGMKLLLEFCSPMDRLCPRP